MARKSGRSCLQIVLLISGAGLFLCVVLGSISALANRNLPVRSTVVERLSEMDKARLAEVWNLKAQYGDRTMPGWAEADIPIVLYNEVYAFLVGIENPPDGWVTVPRGIRRGSAWEPVPDDDFYGQIYYRQRLPEGVTPQGFTVRVGDHWAASFMTMDYMKISLVNQFRQDLPGPVKTVFPYALVVGQFVPGSDYYGTAVLHEAMHAFQGISAAERLESAERANSEWSDRYPWQNEAFQQDWQAELNLLYNIMRSENHEGTRDLARQFLQLRTQRRQAANLSDDLIQFERQREWVEGIGKYAELSAYQYGFSADYQPVAQVLQDSQFQSYRGFQTRWNNEINQIRRMAGDEGDGRFYYSGWVQAEILDRLMPEWKENLFAPDIFLEDLVAEAVE